MTQKTSKRSATGTKTKTTPSGAAATGARTGKETKAATTRAIATGAGAGRETKTAPTGRGKEEIIDRSATAAKVVSR